jgi:hypothetical protein
MWIYTAVLAAAFAMPFYALWRWLGEDKVPVRLARRYALVIFGAAFMVIGLANLASLHYAGKPNYGETG